MIKTYIKVELKDFKNRLSDNRYILSSTPILLKVGNETGGSNKAMCSASEVVVIAVKLPWWHLLL